MDNIEILNKRFGEAFGYPDGVHPRYQWMWKPGQLKGSKHWSLCQLAPNPFTVEQWSAMWGGNKPFPGKMRWVEHVETALPPGVTPTVEHTSFYVRSLRAQLEASEKAEKDQAAGRVDDATLSAEADAQASVDAAAKEFEERVADWEPPSWALGDPQPPGSHDGPIAFQVGGSRDDAPQAEEKETTSV